MVLMCISLITNHVISIFSLVKYLFQVFCIFFHKVVCLFIIVVRIIHFLNSVFQREYLFWWRLIYYFFSMVCAFCVLAEKSLHPPSHTFSPTFFLEVLELYLLIWVYVPFCINWYINMAQSMKSILFLHMDIPLFQHHLLKNLSFPIELLWYFYHELIYKN